MHCITSGTVQYVENVVVLHCVVLRLIVVRIHPLCGVVHGWKIFFVDNNSSNNGNNHAKSTDNNDQNNDNDTKTAYTNDDANNDNNSNSNDTLNKSKINVDKINDTYNLNVNGIDVEEIKSLNENTNDQKLIKTINSGNNNSIQNDEKDINLFFREKNKDKTAVSLCLFHTKHLNA